MEVKDRLDQIIILLQAILVSVNPNAAEVMCEYKPNSSLSEEDVIRVTKKVVGALSKDFSRATGGMF